MGSLRVRQAGRQMSFGSAERWLGHIRRRRGWGGGNSYDFDVVAPQAVVTATLASMPVPFPALCCYQSVREERRAIRNRSLPSLKFRWTFGPVPVRLREGSSYCSFFFASSPIGFLSSSFTRSFLSSKSSLQFCPSLARDATRLCETSTSSRRRSASSSRSTTC